MAEIFREELLGSPGDDPFRIGATGQFGQETGLRRVPPPAPTHRNHRCAL